MIIIVNLCHKFKIVLYIHVTSNNFYRRCGAEFCDQQLLFVKAVVEFDKRISKYFNCTNYSEMLVKSVKTPGSLLPGSKCPIPESFNERHHGSPEITKKTVKM